MEGGSSTLGDVASLTRKWDDLSPNEVKQLFTKLNKSDIKPSSSKQWGARTANENFKLEYIGENTDVRLENYIPPYKRGTFANQIELAEDALFVRVHGTRGQVGRWMINIEDYKNLVKDPDSFKDVFALPSKPSKASLVKIPKGVKIWKGEAAGNKWGTGGGVQIQVDEWSKYLDESEDWFNTLEDLQ